MRYLSVCSGIEAAAAMGFEPVAFSEIEKFPSEVLKQHFPGVPNWGDMTKYKEWPDATIDVLVGGTPCQGFSIAGLRGGMDDARSQLSLAYAGVARRYRPRWVVWENVPGVLSSNGGKDFAEFLGLLSGQHLQIPTQGWRSSGIVPGIDVAYGLAWRVLDAQYFGLAQRRKRVFVVGYLGDWRCAAAVLLDPASMSGDPPPRRKKGKEIAGTLGSRTKSGGSRTTDLDGHGALVPDVSPALKARDFKGPSSDGDGDGAALIPMVFKPCAYTRGKDGEASDLVPPLTADGDRGDTHPVVAFSSKDSGADALEDVSPTLRAMGHNESHANGGGQIAIAIQAGALRENPKSGPDGVGVQEDVAYTIEARSEVQAVAFEARIARNGRGAPEDICPPLKAQSGETGKGDAAPLIAIHDTRGMSKKKENGKGWTDQDVGYTLDTTGAQGIQRAMTVRRLTPRECERLQGFPDDYTLIPWKKKPADKCPDGPRYKALGNSMAKPVMAKLGHRIRLVEVAKLS